MTTRRRAVRAWIAVVTTIVLVGWVASARAETDAPAPAPAPAAGSGSGSAGADDKADDKADKALPSYGALKPGDGFLIGRTKLGEMSISIYALIRYLNQMPPDQIYEDHLGREHVTDPRADIFAHRVMVFLEGWAGVPKLRYQITLWTVNATDQKALFGGIGYQFHKAFSLYGGLNALPGTRTLTGSHPYWLAHDRVMADEYFRTYFTHGIWASGEALPGLNYIGMIGNNLSTLDITAAQLTRRFSYSGNVWWMPTTHEFGRNGGFTDFAYHDKLATRFGAAYSLSHEIRFTQAVSNTPENTTIRLADALNVFEEGALADGATVEKLRYRLLSLDAGIKYRGLFIGAQYFQRWLDQFTANAPLPVTSIVDRGFYVQAAVYPVPHELEIYGATSWVFGDKDAGFKNQYEIIGGANWYFTRSEDIRLNGQFIWIDRSPVSSTFGYYTGGQKGPTVSLGMSINL